MINPHGNILINRILPAPKRKEYLESVSNFKELIVSEEVVREIKNIARGVYSPLKGPLKEEDFQRVVKEMRLKDGTVWPIPIVLDISAKKAEEFKNEKDILLKDFNQKPIAILKDIQIYSFDKDLLAENVFTTKDRAHPGVEEVYKMKDYLIGGEIELLDDSKETFPEYNFTPRETRKIFKEKGWRKIVAFQTRNVPHCGHEFLQKEALKEVDGLFIQRVIGKKKNSDFKDEYILVSYEVLIDRYYPKDRVVLGVLPYKMRYAGPREALLHALVRKNFGCTHFIVGRDHAGVGNYYKPFAAQEIFNNFKKDEIGIEIMTFPEVVYCPIEKKHIFKNNCSHPEKIFFSGTKIRELIKKREQPPKYLMRPEVYYFLANSYNSLVDDLYKKKISQKGFVLWFTGLSQAGKTTIGDKVYEFLKTKGLKVERLDGDIVRQYLSKDLGFSKEDRDENITRIRYVSKLLSRNGIGVIASFISPYRKERDQIRREVKNFIEVFCNCPLEVCETRDTKGLYKKARKGEISNFTGISDPYEKPLNPEIEIRTDRESIESCTNKILDYLSKRKLI